MIDFNKWKVSDLKAELKKRGLPQAGIKSILVARLEEAESGATAQNDSSGSDDSTSTVESPKTVTAVELTDPSEDAVSPQRAEDAVTEPQQTISQAEPAIDSISVTNSTDLPQPGLVGSNRDTDTTAQIEVTTHSTTSINGTDLSQPQPVTSDANTTAQTEEITNSTIMINGTDLTQPEQIASNENTATQIEETTNPTITIDGTNTPQPEPSASNGEVCEDRQKRKRRSQSPSSSIPENSQKRPRTINKNSSIDHDINLESKVMSGDESKDKIELKTLDKDNIELESNVGIEKIDTESKESRSIDVEPHSEMDIDPPHKQDGQVPESENNLETKKEAEVKRQKTIDTQLNNEMEIDSPPKDNAGISEPQNNLEREAGETEPKKQGSIDIDPSKKIEISPSHKKDKAGSKGDGGIEAEPHSDTEIDPPHKQDGVSSSELTGISTQSRRDSRFKGLFNGGENSNEVDMAYDQCELERAVSPAIHPATTALYIRNMQRPLNPQHLRTHLSALAVPSGQSPNPDLISTFYLDPIRTHAFVSFSSIYAASRVRTALHSRIWPEERNRKPLWVDFVPEDKLELWITQEQESNTGGRSTVRKWEVCYDADEHRQVKATLQEATNAPLPAQINPPSTNSQVSSNHIPLGPRTNIDGAPSAPRSHLPIVQSTFVEIAGSKLNELFNSTTTKPILYWKPVSKELANKRLDCLEDSYSAEVKAGGRVMGDPHRYTFEEGDMLVDRGVELVPGLRPPPGYRAPRPGGDRGGYGGGISSRGRGSNGRFRGRGGAGPYRGSYNDKYSHSYDSRSSRDYRSRY